MTSGTDSIIRRIKDRREKTKLDKLIEQTPELSKELERAFRQTLSPENNYEEIDTSHLTPEQAALEVIRRIK